MAATKAAATSKKSPAKSKSGSKISRKTTRATTRPADAIKLLKDNHKEVKTWFDQYADLEDDGEKQALADKICLG